MTILSDNATHTNRHSKPTNHTCLDNVKSTNQFTVNVQLRIRRPVGEDLQTLPNLFIFEYIKMVVFHTANKALKTRSLLC